MMIALIWFCVFNLSWALKCQAYAFSGILLVTFFNQRLQMFLFFHVFVFLTFKILFKRFYICGLTCQKLFAFCVIWRSLNSYNCNWKIETEITLTVHEVIWSLLDVWLCIFSCCFYCYRYGEIKMNRPIPCLWNSSYVSIISSMVKV